jgi:hypothetical protein
MQNCLYVDLVAKYGKNAVGTEIPTGYGTSIDVVVEADKRCFYEIKTATTDKACIRQAIPQLLEYAYWGQGDSKVDELIIVGPAPITADGKAYLAYLRNNFSIPLGYMTYVVPST